MTRTWLLPSLFLASIIFFYTWSLGLSPANDHPNPLANDMLQSARESVHAAMRSLFMTHDGELSKRNPMVRGLGTKLERLQLSLDNFHYEQPSPFRDVAPGELSSSRSVSGPRVGTMYPIDICESLAGKRITMIGGEHIYRLHVLFLQHRERLEGKPFPCQYHEFCTHHHICLPKQHFQADILAPRYVKSPTAQQLIETDSATINYIVSDTLYSERNETSWEYVLPFVDPVTNVRLRETYWLAAARKANIVILGRGPLSAPAETYTGNWSFFSRAPDYIRAAFPGGHGTYNNDQIVPQSLDILNAAVHLTISRFLPDVLQLLKSITAEVRPHRQKRLIWPSSWCRLPGRGVARTALLRARVSSRIQDPLRYSQVYSHRLPQSPAKHVLMIQLSALIDSDATNTSHLEDPWTLFFNAQVYLQNMVLRELLPRHGIVFLPLDVPWVEGDLARRGSLGYIHSPSAEVELERVAAVGEAFLTRLDYVLKYLE